MRKRGPKVHTIFNSRPVIALDAPPPEATCELDDAGRQEFARLVAALKDRQLLDRADVGHISEAARIKARLDKAHKDDDLKAIGVYTSQLRGLRRELGLTLQPSKATRPKGAIEFREVDPRFSRIKLS